MSTRDYLSEAEKMARDGSMLLPERAHLIALLDSRECYARAAIELNRELAAAKRALWQAQQMRVSA